MFEHEEVPTPQPAYEYCISVPEFMQKYTVFPDKKLAKCTCGAVYKGLLCATQLEVAIKHINVVREEDV